MHLAPGESAELVLLLGIAPTRAAVLQLAAAYANASAFDAAFAAAAEHERTCRQRLGISDAQAEWYQALAGAMRYGHPALRAPQDILARIDGGLDTLWQYGIGNGLVAVGCVERNEDRAQVTELLRANAYWRSKALDVKLVLLCAEPLVADVERMLHGGDDGVTVDRVILRRAEIPAEHVDLIQARADLVVTNAVPALGSRVERGTSAGQAVPFRPATGEATRATPDGPLPSNGFGVFAPDGREYVIRVETGESGAARRAPMPWTNVVASDRFGFLVSEGGGSRRRVRRPVGRKCCCVRVTMSSTCSNGLSGGRFSGSTDASHGRQASRPSCCAALRLQFAHDRHHLGGDRVMELHAVRRGVIKPPHAGGRRSRDSCQSPRSSRSRSRSFNNASN